MKIIISLKIKVFRQITCLRQSVGIPFMFSYERFKNIGDYFIAHIMFVFHKDGLPHDVYDSPCAIWLVLSIFLLVYTIYCCAYGNCITSLSCSTRVRVSILALSFSILPSIRTRRYELTSMGNAIFFIALEIK